MKKDSCHLYMGCVPSPVTVGKKKEQGQYTKPSPAGFGVAGIYPLIYPIYASPNHAFQPCPASSTTPPRDSQRSWHRARGEEFHYRFQAGLPPEIYAALLQKLEIMRRDHHVEPWVKGRWWKGRVDGIHQVDSVGFLLACGLLFRHLPRSPESAAPDGGSRSSVHKPLPAASSFQASSRIQASKARGRSTRTPRSAQDYAVSSDEASRTPGDTRGGGGQAELESLADW